MWRGPVTLAVITGVAPAVMPALAAQGPTITASDTVFTPGELTVAPGEAVKLANAGGTHNFRFPDGDDPQPLRQRPLRHRGGRRAHPSPSRGTRPVGA